MTVKTVLVTGAAGFIGAHLCAELLRRNCSVIGLDNFNSYYDPQLKRDRVAQLCPSLTLNTCDLLERQRLSTLFDQVRPTHVVHLAAQAGVRYSLENPHAYVESNLIGFANVLELCRQFEVAHLVYASSSSVYGTSSEPPFVETQRADQPRSFYAATKRANELMAYAYGQICALRTTGLRFFTVYGPWGRPDMAPVQFTRAILTGQPIKVYNYGKMWRDFTYIDDIVAGVIGALTSSHDKDQSHRLFNLGNRRPVALEDFIHVIERAAQRPAVRIYQQMQLGDMDTTIADISLAKSTFGYQPTTSIDVGLPRVVQWCQAYFPQS